MKNPAQRVIEFGQSIWYDNISRDLLNSGELAKIINAWGIRGLTSNPTIFDNAIRSSDTYDSQIEELKSKIDSAEKIFNELAVDDISKAADLLKPIYEESNSTDGYVSIEVSPLLARDAEGTIKEAKELFSKINRENVMIKIPATPECIPAIRSCLEEGINVNVTLIFSVESYTDVANAYIDAIKTRKEKGLAVDKLASVASFFVSRVDALLDPKLPKELQGQFGIANSKLAYAKFKELFESESFKSTGAQVQRPLWASTGTKNVEYSDVLYVDELIGRDTVNTVPHKTLEAFVDHGNPKNSLEGGVEEARVLKEKVESLNIDIEKELLGLQTQGVKKFEDSYHQLIAALKAKL